MSTRLGKIMSAAPGRVQTHRTHGTSVRYYYYGCCDTEFSKKITYNKYFSSWGITTIISIKLIAFYPKSGTLKVPMILCSFICMTWMGPGNPSPEPLGLLCKFLYFLENIWIHSHWDHLKNCSHSIINVVLMIKKKKKMNECSQQWLLFRAWSTESPTSAPSVWLAPGICFELPETVSPALTGWNMAKYIPSAFCPECRIPIEIQRDCKQGSVSTACWGKVYDQTLQSLVPHPGILATNFPFWSQVAQIGFCYLQTINP